MRRPRPAIALYDDLSALLRQVLSTERSRKNREADGHGAKHREPVKAKVVAGKHKEIVKKK